MPNPFDQIVEKEKQKALAKQNADVERFAQKVADQVLANVNMSHNKDELQEIISGLSTAVAGAVVLSNEQIDTNLKDNFSQLLLAVQNNPDDTTLVELTKTIGVSLANLEKTFDKLELRPEIHLTALTREELSNEIDKILARLPENSEREVTIAYENATADKYLNVRLTDGRQFYRAGGASVVVPGSGTSGGLTDEQLRASPVPVSATIDTIGLATDTGQDEIIAAIEAIPTTDVSLLSTSAKQDTLISHVDGIETLLTSIAALTNLVYSKPTDVYSIQAISDDGTYKYYFYEDTALNWYIMRKHIANNVYTYTKGTSGYASVYQSAILGPSGTPTWDTYGGTF